MHLPQLWDSEDEKNPPNPWILQRKMKSRKYERHSLRQLRQVAVFLRGKSKQQIWGFWITFILKCPRLDLKHWAFNSYFEEKIGKYTFQVIESELWTIWIEFTSFSNIGWIDIWGDISPIFFAILICIQSWKQKPMTWSRSNRFASKSVVCGTVAVLCLDPRSREKVERPVPSQ